MGKGDGAYNTYYQIIHTKPLSERKIDMNNKFTLSTGVILLCAGAIYIARISTSKAFELNYIPKTAAVGTAVIAGALIIACTFIFGRRHVQNFKYPSSTPPKPSVPISSSDKAAEEAAKRLASMNVSNVIANNAAKPITRSVTPTPQVEKKIPLLLKKSDIAELYCDEQSEVVLSILKKELKTLSKDTRRYAVLSAIIEANEFHNYAEEKMAEVQNALKQYGAGSDKFKEACGKAGLDVKDESGKTLTLTFVNDTRYSLSINKDNRDKRTKNTLVSRIKKTFF